MKIIKLMDIFINFILFLQTVRVSFICFDLDSIFVNSFSKQNMTLVLDILDVDTGCS